MLPWSLRVCQILLQGGIISTSDDFVALCGSRMWAQQVCKALLAQCCLGGSLVRESQWANQGVQCRQGAFTVYAYGTHSGLLGTSLWISGERHPGIGMQEGSGASGRDEGSNRHKGRRPSCWADRSHSPGGNGIASEFLKPSLPRTLAKPNPGGHVTPESTAQPGGGLSTDNLSCQGGRERKN